MNLFSPEDARRTEELYPLGRHPKFPCCPHCGSKDGRLKTVGGQDTVRCAACDRLLYNAPKTETGREVRTAKTTHDALRDGKRRRVLERGNFACELCGRRPTPEHPLHVGHLLSVRDGMAEGLTEHELNDEENLAAMCDECNLEISAESLPLRLVFSLLLVRVRRKQPKA